MAYAFPTSGGPGVLLFDEDFDLPPAAPEPEVIAPVFSAAELMAAREEAAQDSRDRALAESEASARALVGRTLAQIAVQITETRLEASSIAEQTAEAIARLLLGCFATAFPALAARHGPGELAAVLREILPVLHREPKISVRISPHLVPAMTDEIQSMDADLAARVRLIATDAVAPGDARITWDNGAATRDAASLWGQIEGILAPAGLLPSGSLPPGSLPPGSLAPGSLPTGHFGVRQTAKEHELVE